MNMLVSLHLVIRGLVFLYDLDDAFVGLCIMKG